MPFQPGSFQHAQLTPFITNAGGQELGQPPEPGQPPAPVRP
jgi:hypothetical protein